MYLKALEMIGFKSFPDKIRMEFGKGLTAVVGPNGSGKSNISDAIRWVLGEQSTKTLRGSKMEDIIFNGTVNRKAHGFVEVRLVIDNSDRGMNRDEDEVIISRKYYRSGDSEYRINGVAVRLRDITEMLMDTGIGRDGYSIVGQGAIAEIVSAKPAQRREIFEEAAGISKFRYRREEAEKRLGQAEENLLRLKDIFVMEEARVEPLRQQSEAAQKFLKLAEEKKQLEVSLWMNNIKKARQSLREQEDKILLCRSSYDEIEAEYRETEEQIDAVFAAMQKIAADIELRRDEIKAFEDRVAEMGAEKAVLLNDIKHDEESIERVKAEIEGMQRNAEQTEQQKASIAQRIAEKEGQYQATAEKANEQNNNIAQLSAKRADFAEVLLQFERDSAAFVEKYNAANLEKTRAQSEMEQLNSRAQLLEQSQAEREERISRLLDEKRECSELLEEIEDRMTSLSNMAKGMEMKLAGKQKQLEKIDAEIIGYKREKEAKLSRAKLLEDMEKSKEGFAGSVKFVLGQASRGFLRGIHGTVAELISVEPEYALAVETALGSAMQNIVTDNEDVAKRAVAELKRTNAGRATFMQLTSVKGNRLAERGVDDCIGFVGIAADLVRCDKKYEGIVLNQLGRVVVTETLDDAVAMAKKFSYRFRIVTLDGQVVNSGGSITGGSAVKNAGILSRKSEIEKLGADAEAIDAKVAAAMQPYNSAKDECVKLNAGLVATQSEYKTCAEDKIRYEAELKRIGQLIEDAGRSEEENEKQQLDISKKLKKAVEMKDACEKVLSELQRDIDAVSEKRTELIQKDDGIKQELNDAREKGAALAVEMTGIEKDIEILRLSEAQLQQQIGAREERINSLTEQIEQYNAHIEEINRRITVNAEAAADIEKTVGEKRTMIENFAKERIALEAKTTQMRQEQKQITERREQASRELVRLEERRDAAQSDYDSLIKRLWDEYELTRAQAEEVAQEIENVTAATKRLSELRSAIKALGSVNLSAIEECKEVYEHYIFLKAQIEDVENSRNGIMEQINQLTAEMRSRFSKKFAVIAENFSTIFTELFEGGKGSLVLTEDEDVLEAGIDISVQPPGKIINNLAALSGGEQSMVAIAIYFAIIKASPSPFCILDEVDAALDDVNVTRFAKYLGRLGGKTQFISITHRRGTMESADILYGVTMQEVGVSKLLKLEVSEIESKLNMGSEIK
ncbi:MAG: chromosome segregation protein SMC [Oscillospiraceae bacterium]|nr:chromosome segregation protein SMC [Oscillospiraceae bacterium]